MADKSMKASIQVDMDAKGVARGVAATNRELDKLNKTARSTSISTGIMAGINVVQTAYAAISGIINSINDHINKLDQLGRTFSREGATAEGSRMAAAMQSDIDIGKAMGVSSATNAMIEEKAMRDRAARIQADAANIGGGASFWTDVGETIWGAMVATKDQFIANSSDPFALDSPNVFGATERALGFPQYFFEGMTGADLAGGRGSARGMQYDQQMVEQTRVLRDIHAAQGGQ